MKSFAIIATLVVAFAIIDYGKALHYPQYLQSYRLKSCIGESINLLETMSNNSDPYLLLGKSVSVRGVWTYVTSNGMIVSQAAISSSVSCLSAADNEFMGLVAAEMQQPFDLDDSSLGLYYETFGTPVQIVNSTTVEIKFDSQINVSSWAITGPESYTVFENRDFTGKSTCFEVRQEAQNNGWGISLSSGVQVLVGSVRRGCAQKNANVIKGDDTSLTLVTDLQGNEVKEISKIFSNYDTKNVEFN